MCSSLSFTERSEWNRPSINLQIWRSDANSAKQEDEGKDIAALLLYAMESRGDKKYLTRAHKFFVTNIEIKLSPIKQRERSNGRKVIHLFTFVDVEAHLWYCAPKSPSKKSTLYVLQHFQHRCTNSWIKP